MQALVVMLITRHNRILGALCVLSLVLCHPAVFALTHPVLTNTTVESTSPTSITFLNAEAHCPPEDLDSTKLPLSPDCITAVRMLPNSDYIGTFHIGGRQSLWRLPYSTSYRSCTVSVILHEDVDRDLGSWVDVQRMAIQLLLHCRLPFDPEGWQRTGGWTTAGAENGLVVELKKWSNGAGNGRDVETEQGVTAIDVE